MRPENRDTVELVNDLRHVAAKVINDAQVGKGYPSALHGAGRIKSGLDSAFNFLDLYDSTCDPKYLKLAQNDIEQIAQASMRLLVMIDNHLNDATKRPKIK